MVILMFQLFNLIWKLVFWAFSFIFKNILTHYIIGYTPTLLIIKMFIICKNLMFYCWITLSGTNVLENIFKLASLLWNTWLILRFEFLALANYAFSIIWNWEMLIVIIMKFSVKVIELRTAIFIMILMKLSKYLI